MQNCARRTPKPPSIGLVAQSVVSRSLVALCVTGVEAACRDRSRAAPINVPSSQVKHVSTTGKVKFFNESKGYPFGPVFVDTGDVDGKAVAAIPFQILVP